MDDSIRRTLVDLDAFLRRHDVPFAVIGGIAVAIRGEPRFTADIDVVLGIERDSATELLRSVARSAFEPLFPGVEDVVREAFLLPLRHRRTLVKVDLAVGATGFERQVIRRAPAESIGDLTVPVATAEDLLLMKTLAGRARDADDARGIILRRRGEIDWDYVMETGRQLQEAIDQDLVSPLLALRRESGPLTP
jgi:hypothetical protein